ncbi:monocarboxylate transporter 12-like isoform X2 [Ptychodera flava]
MFVIATAISNALVRRIGHRPTVMLAGALGTTGLLLSSFATSLHQLYFTYGGIAGFGLGMSYMPCVDMTGKYFKRRLSLALGLGMSGTGAGQFLLALVNQLLVDYYGWRGMLLILAAVSFHMCLAGALLRPLKQYKSLQMQESQSLQQDCDSGTAVPFNKTIETASDKVTKSENQTIDERTDGCSARERTCKCCPQRCKRVTEFFSSMYDRALLTHPVYWMHIVVAIGQPIGHITVTTHVVRRLRDFGITDTRSSMIAALMGLAQLVGRPLYGTIANTGRVKPNVLYGIAMATCGAVTIVSIYVKTMAGQIVYILLFGMCVGGYVVLIPIVVTYYHGKDMIGIGTSGLLQIHGIVGLIIAPLAGYLRDKYGEYDQAFWVVVAAYTITSVAAFLLPIVDRLVKNHRKKADSNVRTAYDVKESGVFDESTV